MACGDACSNKIKKQVPNRKSGIGLCRQIVIIAFGLSAVPLALIVHRSNVLTSANAFEFETIHDHHEGFGDTTYYGYADRSPMNIKEGLEKTRSGNLKFMADYVNFKYMAYPCKNTVVMSLPTNYVFGYVSQFAQCKDDAKELLNVVNYKCTEEVKAVLPKVSSQIFSFKQTYAMWSGIFYADLDMKFNREAMEDLYMYYCHSVRNADFRNPELTASVINYMAHAQTGALSNNGPFVRPEMIVDDGRFLIIGIGYFKGSLLECVKVCDTERRTFLLASGRKTHFPTMRVQGKHSHGFMKNFDAEVLEMEFTGNDFNMRIVKPKHINDIQPILNELGNARRYDKIFSNLETYQMDVYMPIIDVHQNYDFMKQIKQFGVKTDLKEINYNGLFDNASNAYLSDAIVDLRLQIDEGIAQSNYTDSCPRYKKKMHSVHLNSTFIYFINTAGGMPVLGGVYTGEN